MTAIIVDGTSLTIDQVIEVALRNAQVEIDSRNFRLIRQSSDFIKDEVVAGKVMYGINTGFGLNASEIINDPAEVEQLQTKLLLSHACGVGENFSTELVRAMMLIRLNTLLAGYSGVHFETIELLKNLVNHRVHPVIPQQGSVGASGDLCPLSHMAIVLIGEGYVEQENGQGDKKIIYAREALSAQSLQPIRLRFKEGIALNNGTSVMSALGVQGVYEGFRLIKLATLASCLSFEALCARKQAFDVRIHQIRKHQGQMEINRWINHFTQHSNLLGLDPGDFLFDLPNELKDELVIQKQWHEVEELKNGLPDKLTGAFFKALPYEPNEPSWRSWDTLFRLAEKKLIPQDAYSVRCTPQILGASLNALYHIREAVENELNAVVDNPLIFIHPGEEDKNAILSGGNFHGQPVAMVLDYLKLAMAEVGDLMERQISKLVDPSTNDFLPAFLVEKPGINSGWMIPQYTAAALVSENKVLVNPASADSIPTSANQEDHVSMGPIAGRQALEIIGNVKKIVAILMLTAAQAVDLRLLQLEKTGFKGKLGASTQQLYDKIRSSVSYLKEDRLLYDDIKMILENFEEFYLISEQEI